MGKKSRAKAARRDHVKDVRESADPAHSRAPERQLPQPVRKGPPAARPSSLAGRVQALLASGEPGSALALLQTSPPAPGEEAGHRNLVGLVLVAMHRYDEAYPLLAEAAEAGLSREIHLALAETEANLGLTAHAERRIRRLSQAYPNHPAIVQAREYARSLKDARQARADALGVESSDLEEAEALLDSTRLLMSRGDYGAAIKVCEQAIERCPPFDRPHITLALAHAASGDETAARDAVHRARAEHVHLSPPHAAAAVRLCVALGEQDLARELAKAYLGGDAGAEGRPWRAEALACLADHDSLRELLHDARDLNPREQFLLGVASANRGDLPAARRALRSALSAGYHDAIVHRSLEWVDQGRQNIPYAAAMELAPPSLSALFNRVLVSGAGVDELQVRAAEDPAAAILIERLMEEEPASALRLYAALGTPEALEKIRQYSADEEKGYADRILALSLLRDAGLIAEDEPVDLLIEGQTLSVVLGQHQIVAEKPIEVPDDHAARLFEEGARLASSDPETAYDRWVEFNEYYPQSVAIKIRLSQLSQALGRLDESREWLEKALALDFNNVEAHIGMAALSLNTGDLRGAIAHSRSVDETVSLTATELVSYQSVREGLSGLLESPLADALMSQADLENDEESADANRELAGVLGAMQKSMALTQYLRQRPIANLREDLTLREVMLQLDGAVIYNAAWLFGLIEELEEAAEESAAHDVGREQSEALDAEDLAGDEAEDEDAKYQPTARELLARELLNPDRLVTGLPGLPDRDLQALEWLLEQGGAAPLEEYLAEFPPDEVAPSDMLLEYGIVAEGRLSGRLTRMIPADLRAPLAEALKLREEW